eukprot:2425-Heterococcus_DN1.PRE.1
MRASPGCISVGGVTRTTRAPRQRRTRRASGRVCKVKASMRNPGTRRSVGRGRAGPASPLASDW